MAEKNRVMNLLDEVERVHDRRWGRWARHQVRGARRLFESRLTEATHTQSLVCTAVGLLAEDMFVFHSGELRWDPEAHLRWREEWSEATSIEAPQVFAMIATCLKNEGEQPWRLRANNRSFDAILLNAPRIPRVADQSMEALYREGLAEIHRHESLTKLPSFVWHRLLAEGLPQNVPYPKGNGKSPDWGKELNRARRIWNAIYEFISQSTQIDSNVFLLPNSLANDERYYSVKQLRNAKVGEDFQPDRMLCIDRNLLAEAFRKLLEGPRNSALESAVHILLLKRSEVESSLVHPPQGFRGLDRFKTEYVDHPWQDNIQASPYALWRQAWDEGGVRWLEIKLGPGRSIRQKTERWLQAAAASSPHDTPSGTVNAAASTTSGHAIGQADCQHLPPGDTPNAHSYAKTAAALGKPSMNEKRPAIRFVLHFIRKPDAQVEEDLSVGGRTRWSAGPRWLKVREEVEKQTRELRDVLRDPTYGQLWVGIDAAAYELDAPAEVFAPAFRLLRAPWALTTFEFSDDKHLVTGIRSLGASVHAGEEFRHIASGMRWIDEHMQFLELRNGDRIGHGLAVGLEPEWWRESVGRQVTQTNLERLDDLVWLSNRWARHPQHAHLCHSIGDEIAELCWKVYNTIYEPFELRAAWKLRELDPLLGDPTHILHDGGSTSSTITPLTSAARHWQRKRICESSQKAVEIWRAYTWDLGVRKRGNEERVVDLRRDWDAPLRTLQDDLLREMSLKGIAIEANPSSNLAIASLGTVRRHPVFRWFPVNPKDRHDLPLPRICIGSDDPAIFYTELGHEFALLAQSARDEGHSERDIRFWIQELRKNAVDLWFGGISGKQITDE